MDILKPKNVSGIIHLSSSISGEMPRWGSNLGLMLANIRVPSINKEVTSNVTGQNISNAGKRNFFGTKVLKAVQDNNSSV